MGALGALLTLAALYETSIQVKENIERHDYFNSAREYSRSVNKPLLCVGMKTKFWQPPDGDVVVDIDPAVLQIRNGIQADIRKMPFSDKQFGACYVSHVLEHLDSMQDVDMAVRECVRVSDKVVFLCPSPYSLFGVFAPEHKLRIWFDSGNNQVGVKTIGQHMTVDDKLPVITDLGNALVIE